MLFTKIGAATTKGLVAASILFGSTISSTAASAAAVCQPGTGCVLPIPDAPPPPPIQSAPPPFAEAPVVSEAGGGGLSLIAILAGLAALGLLAFLLLDDDDEDEVDLPVSP